MRKCDERKQKVYDYICQHIQTYGYPPSVREIGENVGLKSTSSVHSYIKQLEDEGYLTRDGAGARTLRIASDAARENHIPILGTVAAGVPLLAQESIEGYLLYDAGGSSSEHFALRVRGYSMKDAGILPGDLVVVRRRQSADNGDIVVALLGDEATVKRLHRDSSGVWLMPENEDFEPIDGREAQILGCVTALVREY